MAWEQFKAWTQGKEKEDCALAERDTAFLCHDAGAVQVSGTGTGSVANTTRRNVLSSPARRVPRERLPAGRSFPRRETGSFKPGLLHICVTSASGRVATPPIPTNQRTMTNANSTTDRTETRPNGGRPFAKPTITLILEPVGGTKTVPRPKTVRQLLDSLNHLEETALVIRDGRLLTPDLAIHPGDTVTVRSIISHG